MTRVLVCGGRDYADKARAFKVLDAAVERLGLTDIIHGGASGADDLAGQWAKARSVPSREYPAEWYQGKASGPIRNQRILDEGKPDLVLAFKGGRGTQDMVRRAEKAGVRVIKIDW